MQKSPPYIFSADVVRALAIFGVVAIHTANAVYARPDFLGGIAWWIAIIIDSLSRISIPLFIMLSGYLLLEKEETFEKSLKRTTFRIFIPLLLWTLLYMAWNGGNPTFAFLNGSFFSRLFSVNVFDLYFLVIMLGLYIILPFLRAFLHAASSVSQKNFLVFALIVGALQAIGEYVFQQCGATTIFTMWIPYTGVFVAGYLLGKNAANIKRTLQLAVAYGVGLSATLILNYAHYFFLTKGTDFLNGPGCLSHYGDYYLSINVLLMSLSAFVFLIRFRYQSIKDNAIGKFIGSIARASFGIYLIHLLLVEYSETDLHLTLDQTRLPLLTYLFGKWLIIFFLSYLLSFIILKLPWLRWIIGGK